MGMIYLKSRYVTVSADKRYTTPSDAMTVSNVKAGTKITCQDGVKRYQAMAAPNTTNEIKKSTKHPPTVPVGTNILGK